MGSREGWPTGTVTFLFTDVEDSTRRWREDEVAMAELLRRHDAVLGASIVGQGGVLFKHTGDGVVAAFWSPSAAVAAALAALAELELPVRMGVHTGEAELRDGDYFGSTLNRAARVMDAGHGGQLLVSQATAALLGGHDLVELGIYELKGIDIPERIHQVGRATFPELRSHRSVVGNLPRELTEFVGRRDEVDRITSLLVDHQLVTLFGVGGTGKTRLAIEAAASLSGQFDDGVWLVELGRVLIEEAVPFAMTNSVGLIAPREGDVAADLVRRLAEREMLIVVDNCEHVVAVVADLVQRIVEQCPLVRIVATSREPLMVRTEQVFPVGPLPELDAAELFVARARSELPGVEFDEQQKAAIASLCQRLDGLPLAIELAAARVRSFTPVDLLEALDERFRLLVGSSRSRVERHQTMRATLDWSYTLCDAVDQRVFDRLSVFPASFDLAAARGVAADDVVSSFDVVDAVSRLVDRSLVQAGESVEGSGRFRLLETMRSYGREHLRDHEDGGRDARERHARHVADSLDRLSFDLLGPQEAVIIGRIDELLADALVALDWFIDHHDWHQAMRMTPPYFPTRTSEHDAMMARLHAAIDATGEQIDFRDEIKYATPADALYEFPEGDDVIGQLTSVNTYPDRDSYALWLLLGVAGVPASGADAVVQAVEHYNDARPLTRYMVFWTAARRLAMAGHLEHARQVLDEFGRFAAARKSAILRSAATEVEGSIHRSQGRWAEAAACYLAAIEQRLESLPPRTSFFALVGGHATACRGLSGDPVDLAELRSLWRLNHELGWNPPPVRLGIASEITLSARGHAGLADRFLTLARHSDDAAVYQWFAIELEAAGLEVDPDANAEPVADLLAELDELIADQ